jgi:hypothetical protein
MEVKSYRIPMPERYILRIKGLDPGSRPDDKHKIVFMRPHLARTIAYAIGIVLAGFLFIGSIVLFFLRLLSHRGVA